MGDNDDIDTSNANSLNPFKTKFSKMPCFRSTFLTSIPTGIVSGFAYFMFTSKTRMAIHVGYFSFFTMTFAYWGYCRYKWSVDKFNFDKLQEAVKLANIMDGTEKANDINESIKSA